MTTHTFNFSNNSTDTCTHSNTCYHCGESNEIILDFTAFMRWYNGDGLIQDIWPNLTGDERELILSGIHPECWNRMFAQDVTV
jgi:hypothetical protein